MAEKLQNSLPKCLAVQPTPSAEEPDPRRSFLRDLTIQMNDLNIDKKWLLEKLMAYTNDEKMLKSVVDIIFKNSIFTDRATGRVCANVCVYISKNIGADSTDPHAIVRRVRRYEFEDDTNDLNRTFRRVVLAKLGENMAKFKPMLWTDPPRFREFVVFISELFGVSNGLSLFSIPRERDVCDLFTLLLDFPDEANLDCLQVVLGDSYYLMKDAEYFEQLVLKLQCLLIGEAMEGCDRSELKNVFRNAICHVRGVRKL